MAFALVSSVALWGCGSDDPAETGSSGGGDTKQGFTECGDLECQPGQFCDNLFCQAGCQSNVNCAEDQTCEAIDEVTKIGTCQNKAEPPPPPPEKDCETFCQKAQACNDPDADKCQQACDAVSAECVSCVNDSDCGAGCEAACGLQ